MEQDAKHGLMENVQNAQTNGISILTMSVNQLAIFAELGLLLEIVKPAIQVMLSLKDNAFQIQIFSDQPKMIFALHGKIKFVLNVLIELISMLTEFVMQFQLNAQLGIYLMDCV